MFSKSLFIILQKCESTILADNFTKFGGVVLGPAAFLMFLATLFTSDALVLGISKVSVSFRFFHISRIL